MKKTDLYKAVSQLGFSGSSETVESGIMSAAINCALRELYRLGQKTHIMRLGHYPLKPIFHIPNMQNTAGGRKYEVHGAMSVCFEANGSGTLTLISLSDPDCRQVFSWSSGAEFTTVRFFVHESLGRTSHSESDDICLSFSGGCVYRVKDLTVYSERLSDREQDIVPVSSSYRYDLSEIDSLFGHIVGIPTLNGSQVSGWDNDGNYLVLPASKTGVWEIEYERRAPLVTEDTEEIEVDPSMEDLLVLLTSVYVWREEEPVLADKYFEIYKSMVSRISKLRKPSRKGRLSTDGWDM